MLARHFIGLETAANRLHAVWIGVGWTAPSALASTRDERSALTPYRRSCSRYANPSASTYSRGTLRWLTPTFPMQPSQMLAMARRPTRSWRLSHCSCSCCARWCTSTGVGRNCCRGPRVAQCCSDCFLVRRSQSAHRLLPLKSAAKIYRPVAGSGLLRLLQTCDASAWIDASGRR